MWRLAKSELLQLSRVCSHWHTLAIGTPIFWSDIELHLHYLHTEPAKYMQEMMELLQASIERARNAPLTVILRCGYHLSSSPVLQLLAQFSHRMEKISIVGRFSSLHEFAIMESELPLLRSLELDVEGLKSRGSFQSTPQLEEIICWGPVQDACTVPLSRLRKLSYQTIFHLGIIIEENDVTDISLPPVTSDISTLVLAFSPYWTEEDFDEDSVEDTAHVLSVVLDSLTLPHLRSFTASSDTYPNMLIPWLHTKFLEMFTRSTFHCHLETLDISHAMITESELIHCLAQLPALVDLSIADHDEMIHSSDPLHGADIILITTNLLHRLTWVPDTEKCLVPCLRALRCKTRLEFHEDAFLQLVLSRLEPGLPFLVEMQWFPAYHPEWQPDIMAQLCELQRLGKFDFLFEIYNFFPVRSKREVDEITAHSSTVLAS
ncbi:hypothetical protein C8J57DRAFT_1530947 [Mycena rebaudengoi]|nr:hypothetical protein C8J57DRAFT_1530947 [Mycena rebaudengoi]